MNAGRILRDAGHDIDALRALIAPVHPDDINVWPASTLFRRVWRPGIRAVTHGRLVFVDPGVMVGDRRHLARLVIHELIHVRQYRVVGYLRFVTSYIREYLTARFGGLDPDEAYRQISYEREARELTERMVSSIR